ncbi:hypothetical protein Sj15T_22800 [Sphingobium sp. TA15]|uniref:Glycosyltransferase WbpX n=1 Tax=Sphingobium indicum (strain DSM 16413 / CCM 7287 / MTCC 6362 / UT26 / NBRC 101211 / UT26S) TaxID=452662 RepID=D4Z5I7_SPHIU|nr:MULTISPECIES: glycosyltransferase family 1 protein [Sphingobium]WDA38700.1 glycosyltransferase family 1 protein [Sphingobium sp. YC-XJ3]BAI97869.1 glycosyltransferase WbpX [Sphingobium indicum UT26S]BDD67259.1 hypothetical protein Sj15T_22800 [Sphingobium sp. TA15]
MTGMSSGRVPNIWMNVTTSANWTRAAVGIVRVEQEICRELELLYGKRFRKCVFQNGEFVPFEGRFGASSVPQGVIWPDGSRDFPKTYALDPAFGGNRASTTPNDPVAQTREPSINQYPRLSDIGSIGIEYGDVLISVGLDWDHSYIDKFYELKKRMGIRIVACCYDLIPVLYPQYCVGHVAAGFKEYFGKLSWSSSTMLCISNQSRKDYRELVRRIGAPEIPSVVIPLGDKVPDAEGEISTQIRRLADKPYILFVSTIERRKNHEVLYRAYHLLAKAGHADKLPKLVFVGMPGWGVGDLLKDIELDPLTDGLIVQLNHVDDAELSYLYHNATFMAYPSLYEGWGLPVGEALACGKAVVASAQGSIPEVGGDLVVYVDPWNAQAWADEILRLIENPDELKALEDAIVKGYKSRTWFDTAKAVKDAVDALGPVESKPLILLPGYDMRTMSGIHCGEAMRSRGDKGVFLFGPYWPLAKGSYSIAIDMQKIGTAAGELNISVVHNHGLVELNAKKIIFHRGDEFEGHININIENSENIKDLEIVFESTDGLLVSVDKIIISNVNFETQSGHLEKRRAFGPT